MYTKKPTPQKTRHPCEICGKPLLDFELFLNAKKHTYCNVHSTDKIKKHLPDDDFISQSKIL